MHIAPTALLGLFLLNVASAAVPPAPRPPSPPPPRKNSVELILPTSREMFMVYCRYRAARRRHQFGEREGDYDYVGYRRFAKQDVGLAGLGVINWIGDLVLLYP
ncbi:hypothetical protein FRC09_004326 [Ceratobasidium sp. 395]|nr:hypothetical protein FRC09_004326 [Ceratobasidium sp. 395]